MKNKAFIFDLGRVLANFDLDLAFIEFSKYSKSRYTKEKIMDIVFSHGNKQIIVDYELGRIISEEFYEKWSNLLDIDIDFIKFKEIWGSVFNENIGMRSILELIKNEQKIILSNTDPIHWEAVKKFGIVKDYFEDENCIRSYNVGFRKPSVEIFEIAKKQLNKGFEIIYIDDVKEYVDFAKTIGLHSIQYDCRFDTLEKVGNLI